MTSERERFYYVYILGSISGTLYIGITGKLRRRIWEHKQHSFDGFTSEYDVTRLLYFERFRDVGRAIAREQQLKGWRRDKKIALTEKTNPQWEDLSRDWYVDHPMTIAPPRPSRP
jgi:putative endonuclease